MHVYLSHLFKSRLSEKRGNNLLSRHKGERKQTVSTRILPAIWMGKMHDKSEGLNVNPWYSKLELTLSCLKACFFRQDHGLTPRAGRKLVDLKSKHCLSAWITHFSTTLLSLIMLEIQNPEVSPSPGRDLAPCASWQVSGLALQIWAWTQICAESPTAKAELETQLFPTVTSANSVYATKSSINWHNNYNYIV